MLKRKENGKLSLNTLDLEILLGDLFEQCKSEREVEWLKEEIQGSTENIADERLGEIENN